MNNKLKGWLYTLNWEPIRKFDCYGTSENFTGINYNEFGTFYRLNGLRHREDGPAVEYSNSNKSSYWLFGKIINAPSNEAFILYVNLLKLKGLL